MQDVAVGLQHGTRADGDSLSCIKGHYPLVKIFTFKDPFVDILNEYIVFILYIYFSPLQVKNIPH